MNAPLRNATLAADAAADALAEAGARRGLAAGVLLGAAFGGFVSLAFLGLALPGLALGGVLGTAIGSAIGASIAASSGGWWRGILATLIPGAALCVPLGVLDGPWLLVPPFVLASLGAGVGAWLDHSLEDLRLASREASHRARVTVG